MIPMMIGQPAVLIAGCHLKGGDVSHAQLSMTLSATSMIGWW